MNNPYDSIGGEAMVRRLVDVFYDTMDTDPSVATTRAMHPEDLSESRDKLFEFLSGWMGGPPLYVEKRGHPMLRRRHFPFAVDQSASDEWMRCMDVALDTVVEDVAFRTWLRERFQNVANHMINRR